MRYFVFVLLLIIPFKVLSSDQGLFDYPEVDFSKLDAIEEYVNTHPDWEQNGGILQLMSGSGPVDTSVLMMKEPVKGPHNFPSFWWGCLFNFFGAGYVLADTGDFKEFAKAAGGCIVQDATILIVLFSTILK